MIICKLITLKILLHLDILHQQKYERYPNPN